MRVAVVGAGIIGVTTAYELAVAGHDVTVLERHGSIAAETSFANAGLVAPGYVTPWAGPGMLGKVVGQLGRRHAAVRVHPNFDLGWAWQWWRAGRLRTYQANRLRMQRLATFSRERLHEVTSVEEIDYERREGYLVLLRSRLDLALARPGLETLKALGTRFEILDAQGCRAVEPGLSSTTPLHAGIHLPDDEVGNCRQFAMLLRRKAEQHGARFHLNTLVQRIEPAASPRVVTLRGGSDPSPSGLHHRVCEPSDADGADTVPFEAEPAIETYDAVVVCAAIAAPALLRPLGLRLPILPVYGYSVTAPLRTNDDPVEQGPRSALMDERYKVAISRIGNRIRVAGSAEIGGTPDGRHAGALATLYRVLDDWFPGAARTRDAQEWKGARPMLPDGPPVIGPSGLAGVWLNVGHGSSGWALACGSASVVAASISGKPPPIDLDGLGVERLRR